MKGHTGKSWPAHHIAHSMAAEASASEGPPAAAAGSPDLCGKSQGLLEVLAQVAHVGVRARGIGRERLEETSRTWYVGPGLISAKRANKCILFGEASHATSLRRLPCSTEMRQREAVTTSEIN